MIKLIGIDVDGTLLDSHGRLPDENVSAIQDAVSTGVHIALVTGRSYPWARTVAAALPDSITLIVSNGAMERAQDGTTLARHLLPRDHARLILEETRQDRGSAALIFDRETPGQIVSETMDWGHPERRGYFERNRGFIAHVDALEDALTEDPVQVMFNGGVDQMRPIAAALRRSGLFAVSVTEYRARDFTLVDVTADQATKGQALMRRARALGVQRHEVMAVGDNLNDIEMLEAVGIPVAMGNAVPDLKVRGWPITGHHDEAGLAQAIRKFVRR